MYKRQAPYFAPEEEEDITIDTALTCLCITLDPAYHVLQKHIDEDYILCTNDIIGNTSRSSLIQTLSGVRDRLNLQNNLILLDSTRIVPPTSAIKDILARLHAGHGGKEKTLFFIGLACQMMFVRLFKHASLVTNVCHLRRKIHR